MVFGVWALVSSAGLAQTLLKARPLLDDEAMAHLAVYRVDIERKGSDTRGALTLELGGGRIVEPLDLATGARKRLYFAAPAQTPFGGYAFWRLVWAGEDGERIVQELPTPLHTRLPVVFVGDSIGGWEGLQQIRLPFGSALATDHEAFSPPLHAYYMRPVELPDDWRALLGLPLMVLTDGAERLSDAQWGAIRVWLALGGTLVVSAGSFGAGANLLPLADLTPRLSLRDAPVRPNLGSYAPPREPVRLLRPESLNGYRVVLGDARTPVLLYRAFGGGNLYLFLGDLNAPAWRGWQHLPAMLQTIVSSSAFPTERIEGTFTRAKSTPPESRVARVWWGVGVLGVYCVGVWQLAAWLRRRRRLASVFAPLAGITVAACACVLLAAPRAQSQPLTAYRTLAIASDALAVEAGSVQGTLQAGAHTIRLPEGALLLRVEPSPQARGLTESSATIRTAGWTVMELTYLCPATRFPRVRARRVGQTVVVSNRSAHPLLNLRLLVREARDQEPRTLWQLGRLSGGQTARAPLKAPIPEGAYLYLTATSDPNACEPIQIRGADVKEVVQVFVSVD
ncbi:MAG: hypothetical protein KatS3mg018_2127 [Fimbriimonadales bacterium]|nr:MAG: hypothetical protein KatS3mg018_2127 [Fimbriimonadales bacterium]